MATDAHPPLTSPLTLAQLAREQRLQLIVLKRLPPFRQTALELARVLGGASPDLKKAGQLISADPTLSSQVLRMCNSPLLGMHSRVISIDHAASLLGPERLRSLALTTSVADFAGKALPEAQMGAFWQHSFLTATLSQYLAERWEYSEEHQAYIAGLLHDIGQIPEWMLASAGNAECEAPPADWADNPAIEHEYFGIDHCKLGDIMARSWGLMPSFLDVLENHHTPELAQRDSVLVRIVATVDSFLLAKAQLTKERAAKGQSTEELAPPSRKSGRLLPRETQRFVELGHGLFGETQWPRVQEPLEREYARVLPIARAGIQGLLGSHSDSAHDSDHDSKATLQPDRDPDVSLPGSSSQGQLEAVAPQTQTRVRAVASHPAHATLLSRCKGFFKQLFS
jgi:HD-like signal output (HDOD) protein